MAGENSYRFSVEAVPEQQSRTQWKVGSDVVPRYREAL